VKALELSLRNYRVFEEVDLELPARVIGIFGENGSGKSTLMESVAFALYGVNAARTKKQEIRTQGVLADCLVRLAFEHGGQQYEVRRSLIGRNSTPEAELFVGDLILASGTAEVNGEVERLLHMDLPVFRASAFAEQKQLDAFSDMTPGKRQEMALRLLGIRPVDDARTAARREARASKQSAEQLTGAVADLTELEGRQKEAKDLVREAREGTKAVAAELKEATARQRTAKQAFEVSDAARQRVEKITVALEGATEQHAGLTEQRAHLAERVEALELDLATLESVELELEGLAGVDATLRTAERLVELSATLEVAERELGALPEIDAETAIAELKQTQHAVRAAEKAEADARAKHEHEGSMLADAQDREARAADADPSQPCPTCGRELGDDFSAYRAHCRAEVASAKKRVMAAAKAEKETAAARTKVEAVLGRAELAHEAVRASTTRRGALVEQLDTLRSQVASLAEPFDGAVPDVGALRDAVGRARELGHRLAELRVEGKRLEDARRDLTKAETQLETLEAKIAGLMEEAEGLSFDPDEHRVARETLEVAETALEQARERERKMKDVLAAAELELGRLEGEIKQAKETAARVDELRMESRHVERVAMLLDGFRDHLVSRIGPDLSREAEALFRELTNHEYDDLKIDEESLTIQIADGDAYHPIERFSGSESDLANLALRVAISTHLSRVSGADVGMMVLDEVLGSLDEERKDLMVQTLGRLAGRFHQLFVITHAERVKDQFPASIQVSKVGRRRSTAVLI
jgi:exonuclease SbcC